MRKCRIFFSMDLGTRIGNERFDRLASSWHDEQTLLKIAIDPYESANQFYMEDGIRLLDLANGAYELFQKQEPKEQRKLLNFLLSNCS